MRIWASTFLILFLAACGSDQPKSAPGGNSVQAASPASSASSAPNNAPVFRKIWITSGDLPEGSYTILQKLNVAKGWYGATEDAEEDMADRARALGADAVILVKTWQSPSFVAWATPHASGEAVKFTHPESLDFAALPGRWR